MTVDKKKPPRDDDIGRHQVNPESGKEIITSLFYQGRSYMSSSCRKENS